MYLQNCFADTLVRLFNEPEFSTFWKPCPAIYVNFDDYDYLYVAQIKKSIRFKTSFATITMSNHTFIRGITKTKQVYQMQSTNVYHGWYVNSHVFPPFIFHPLLNLIKQRQPINCPPGTRPFIHALLIDANKLRRMLTHKLCQQHRGYSQYQPKGLSKQNRSKTTCTKAENWFGIGGEKNRGLCKIRGK